MCFNDCITIAGITIRDSVAIPPLALIFGLVGGAFADAGFALVGGWLFPHPIVEGVAAGQHGEGGRAGGKFKVIKDSAGQYHFKLNAPNGKTMIVSQAYTTNDSARRGIESVKAHASSAAVDDETDE